MLTYNERIEIDTWRMANWNRARKGTILGRF